MSEGAFINMNNLPSFFHNFGFLVHPMDKEDALGIWREIFFNGVTTERKEQTPHYNEDFSWHIFSFGLVRAEEGDSAEKIYDSGHLYFSSCRSVDVCQNP